MKLRAGKTPGAPKLPTTPFFLTHSVMTADALLRTVALLFAAFSGGPSQMTPCQALVSRRDRQPAKSTITEYLTSLSP